MSTVARLDAAALEIKRGKLADLLLDISPEQRTLFWKMQIQRAAYKKTSLEALFGNTDHVNSAIELVERTIAKNSKTGRYIAEEANVP